MHRVLLFSVKYSKTVLLGFLSLFLICGFLILPFNKVFSGHYLFGNPFYSLTTEVPIPEGLLLGRAPVEVLNQHRPFSELNLFPKGEKPPSVQEFLEALNLLIEGPSLFKQNPKGWKTLFDQFPQREVFLNKINFINQAHSPEAMLNSKTQKISNRFCLDLFFHDLLPPGRFWPDCHAGLEINSSMARILLDNDPENGIYQNYKNTFGDDEMCVVALKAPQVYEPGFLLDLKDLTERIESLPGVDEVNSLTNLDDFFNSEEGFEIKKIADPFPKTPEQMEKFKQRVMGNQNLARTLISEDGKTTALNIYFKVRPDSDWRYKQESVLEIQNLTREKFQNQRGVEYHIGGLAPFTVDLHNFMLQDVSLFFTLTFLVIIVILYYNFRTFPGVWIPLTGILLTITLDLGFIVAIGSSISLVTTIIPAILISVTSSYAIHLATHFYQALRESQTEEEVYKTLSEVSWPVFLSGVTTFGGFISLMANPVNTVREFGLFCGVGILIGMGVSLVFIPALFKWAGSNPDPSIIQTPLPISNFIQTISKNVLNYRKIILLFTLALVVFSLLGILKLEIYTDYTTFFKPEAEVPTTVRFIREHLSAERLVVVVLDSGKEGGAREPTFLHRMEKLQNFAENYQEGVIPGWNPDLSQVSQTIGLTDFLKRMNRAFNEDKIEFEILPDSRPLVCQYLLMYGKRKELNRFLDPTRQTCALFFRYGPTRSDDLLKFAGRVKQEGGKLFNQKGESCEVTGSVYLLQKSANSISYGQIYSLVCAFFVVFMIIFLVFKDLPLALISIGPNLLPILANFGLMGHLGLSVNTGTSIVASIALGIAVDDTIHLLTQFKKEISKGFSKKEAISNSLRHCGLAVVFTSVTLTLGFLVLCGSNFIPIQAVGVLTATTMMVALAADLFLTPILIDIFYPQPGIQNHESL